MSNFVLSGFQRELNHIREGNPTLQEVENLHIKIQKLIERNQSQMDALYTQETARVNEGRIALKEAIRSTEELSLKRNEMIEKLSEATSLAAVPGG